MIRLGCLFILVHTDLPCSFSNCIISQYIINNSPWHLTLYYTSDSCLVLLLYSCPLTYLPNLWLLNISVAFFFAILIILFSWPGLTILSGTVDPDRETLQSSTLGKVNPFCSRAWPGSSLGQTFPRYSPCRGNRNYTKKGSVLSSKGSCLQDSAVPIICNCALGNSKYLEINYIVLPKLISPESSLFMKALVETDRKSVV